LLALKQAQGCIQASWPFDRETQAAAAVLGKSLHDLWARGICAFKPMMKRLDPTGLAEVRAWLHFAGPAQPRLGGGVQ
jgi:hypothetical protein